MKSGTKWNIDLKIGIVIILFVVSLSVISLFYTPYGFNAMDSQNRFIAPGYPHIMGTDNYGRDIFTRVMIGGKYTLTVALAVACSSAVIGSVLGLTAGYAGGVSNEVVMRLMDTISAFPGILLALVMIALLGGTQKTLILALSVLFIPLFCRITRNGMLQYKEYDFVKVAEIMGVPRLRIIFVHILPNLLPSLLSAFSLGLSNAILAEAGMSYLGLGIPPPIPSWGRMLSESQSFLFRSPWCALAPGFMIMITVIGFHLIGEGIRKRYI